MIIVYITFDHWRGIQECPTRRFRSKEWKQRIQIISTIKKINQETAAVTDLEGRPPALKLVSENAGRDIDTLRAKQQVMGHLANLAAAILMTIAGSKSAAPIMPNVLRLIEAQKKLEALSGSLLAPDDERQALSLPKVELRPDASDTQYREFEYTAGIETIVNGALRLAAHQVLKEREHFGGKYSTLAIEKGIERVVRASGGPQKRRRNQSRLDNSPSSSELWLESSLPRQGYWPIASVNAVSLHRSRPEVRGRALSRRSSPWLCEKPRVLSGAAEARLSKAQMELLRTGMQAVSLTEGKDYIFETRAADSDSRASLYSMSCPTSRPRGSDRMRAEGKAWARPDARRAPRDSRRHVPPRLPLATRLMHERRRPERKLQAL
jgi:hypothetical protein